VGKYYSIRKLSGLVSILLSIQLTIQLRRYGQLVQLV